MKKIIAITVLGLMGLASCKKTYVCTCTDNSTLTMTKQTKKNAEASCEDQEIVTSQVTPNTTCTLTIK